MCVSSVVSLVGGSRSLPSSAAPLVRAVLLGLLSSGGSLRVGCAAGADHQAIQAALFARAGARLSVFAVGSQAGAGFWAGSAPLVLLARAGRAGACVSWQAGGPLQAPLRARLIRRSQAALAGASQAVFFLASPSSPGSLRVASLAAQAGKPVYVFCVGFAGPPSPLAGSPGQWSPASLAGHPCFVWQPAQAALF